MSEIIEDFDPNTGESNSKKHKKKRKITPFIIHGGFLLLLVLVVLLFFFLDFSLFGDSEQRPELTVLGKQENFSLPYQGDLDVETSKYNLETNSGNFDGSNSGFLIKDFNGTIEKIGDDLVFSGRATNISFGSNTIRLDNSQFSLNSSKKTTVSLNLDSLSMDLNKGIVKFGSRLSYDFDTASIMMSKANTTMSYDGTFSFTSFVEHFSVDTPENLQISYTQEEE